MNASIDLLEQRRLLAAVSWDGGGNGTTWTDPLNWSGNALPTAADAVTIDVPGSLTVTLGSTTQVGSLLLRETLRINGATLTAVSLDLGGTLDLSSTATLRTTTSANLNLAPAATLRVELQNATTFGRLVVGTTLALDGPAETALQVVPLAGFNPADYVALQPITAASIVGSFDHYSGATTSGGKALQLSVKPEETPFFDAGGFEDPGYVVNNELSSTSPWLRSGAASVTGKVSNVARSGIKGVTMNRPSSVAPFSALRVYPNITPAAAPADRKHLWISWDMYLPTPASTANLGPFMGMEAYGALASGGYVRLGAAGVDARTGEVLWLNTFFQTGSPTTVVAFDTWHHFDLVLDYNTNRYAVMVNGNVLAAAASVPFQGVATLFGDADITAVQSQPEPPIAAGTGHFDNYNVGFRANAAGTTSRVAFALRPSASILPTPTVIPSFEFQRRLALNVDFDQDVALFLSKEDFQVVSLPSLTPVSTPATFTYDASLQRATLNFGGALPDGNYRLTFAAGAVQSPTGANSAATVLDFFILRGDADRDRDVDFDDLLVVAQNYEKPNQNFSQGNFDFDAGGEVDFDDLLILAQRYETSLPAARAAPSSAKRRRDVGEIV